jgi:hypothetical protein
MSIIHKKRTKHKKHKSNDKLLKLTIVFAPVIFFLTVYFLSGIAFDYTSKKYSRLKYEEKVKGVLNMVKDKLFDDETAQEDNKLSQD